MLNSYPKMHLNDIRINNFRTFRELKISFNPKMNIFIGSNGQGKTNLLEAIYFLCMRRSFRTSKEEEFIALGDSSLVVSGTIVKRGMELFVEQFLNHSQRRCRINGNVVHRLIDIIGELLICVFSPEDLYIIKGAPERRRQFIDILISQSNKGYLHNLQQYHRILKQRNRTLLDCKIGVEKEELLELWDEQFIEVGLTILQKRKEVVDLLNPLAKKFHKMISDGLEELALAYKPSFWGEKSDFREALKRRRREEIAKGMTLLGPHRDELWITINNFDARAFASEGQQRSAAIALRSAELNYLAEQMDEYPILLLDDVFSELDFIRQSCIINSIEDHTQVFITTTSLTNLHLDDLTRWIFEINRGEVVKIE